MEQRSQSLICSCAVLLLHLHSACSAARGLQSDCADTGSAVERRDARSGNLLLRHAGAPAAPSSSPRRFQGGVGDAAYAAEIVRQLDSSRLWRSLYASSGRC
jgi:hypothetical protein